MASPAPAAGLWTWITGRHHLLSSPSLVSILGFRPTQVTILLVSMVSPVMWSRLSPSVEEYNICGISSWSWSFWMNVKTEGRSNNVALGKIVNEYGGLFQVSANCFRSSSLIEMEKNQFARSKAAHHGTESVLIFCSKYITFGRAAAVGFLPDGVCSDPLPSSSFQLMFSWARGVN